MKKTLLVLAVLAFVAPAMAGVSIDVNDLGGGVAAIQYTTDANVSAFGLKVTVDAGTIEAVSPNKVGESNSTSKGYGIFLGTIDINSTTGDVDNYGSPVAPNNPDKGTAGTGLDTNTVILELGALYEDGNQPAWSGTLCQITVSECCKMTVVVDPYPRCGQTAGAQDAGAVLEDGTPVVPTLTGATAVDIDYNCGCDCVGDVDGNTFVNRNDIGSLVTWIGANTSPPAYSIGGMTGDCKDIDGNGFVNRNDIGSLVTWIGANTSMPAYSVACSINHP
jgi:hypothetical protein